MTLPQLQAAWNEKFRNKFLSSTPSNYIAHEFMEQQVKFLDSYAQTVWDAAIDGALDNLPGTKDPFTATPASAWGHPNGWNACKEEARDKLSALKSKGV